MGSNVSLPLEPTPSSARLSRRLLYYIEYIEKCPRTDNLDPFPDFEFQKMLVSGNDETGVSRGCALGNFVVRRMLDNRARTSFWMSQFAAKHNGLKKG